jgi:hypothetical protein
VRTPKIVSLAALFAAAAALAFGSVGQAAAVAPAAKSAEFHLKTTATDVKFLGEKQLPGGDYTATWKMFGETVKVAAPAGSTVTVAKPSHGQATASVQVPASLRKGNLRALAAAYAASGKSVYQDALAVGYSPAQAARIAAPTTRTANVVQPMTAAGSIISTPCVSTSGDAGNAYGRACDVQKMMQDNGGGNWIVGDEVTGSGNDTDWADSLSGLAAYVNYGSGNTVIKWTPNSTVNAGNCQTISLGVSYNGVSASDSQTICPARIDPYGTNTSTRFGSKWSGCDSSNWVEGVPSDDIVNDPSYASSNPNLTVTIWWAYC